MADPSSSLSSASSSTSAMQTSPERQQKSMSIDEEDESVRIAVSALGDMRNSARIPPTYQQASTQPTLPPVSSLVSPNLADQERDPDCPDFVSRVSHYPIVNTAIRAYEHGKASSRVVKYGAEMMESSVKTISRPVIDRLPVNVNQLDEFACRQLDRFEKYSCPPPNETGSMQVDDQDEARLHEYLKTCDSSWQSAISLYDEYHSNLLKKPKNDSRNSSSTWLDDHGTDVKSSPNRPGSSRSPTPRANGETSDQSQQAVVQRSGWQAVLLEAGGIGAAVSEESMRRLKYCLQWLQYATSHIDAQIVILRDFIVSLESCTSSFAMSDGTISATHMRTLTEVRRDVVHTIREVVDVVSKYAGGALPEPARARVRGFILHLPQRWASASHSIIDGGGTNGTGSGVSASTSPAVGAAASAGGAAGRSRRGGRYQHHRDRGPSTSASASTGGSVLNRSQSGTPGSSRASSPVPRMSRPTGLPPTVVAATQAGQKILTLAIESLDMMRGVTVVVKESLDRADAWVERLRIVGLQRQQQRSETETNDTHMISFNATPSSSYSHNYRLAGENILSTLPTLSSSVSSASGTPVRGGTPYSSIPSTPVDSGYGFDAHHSPATASMTSLSLDGYETAKGEVFLEDDERPSDRGLRARNRNTVSVDSRRSSSQRMDTDNA